MFKSLYIIVHSSIVPGEISPEGSRERERVKEMLLAILNGVYNTLGAVLFVDLIRHRFVIWLRACRKIDYVFHLFAINSTVPNLITKKKSRWLQLLFNLPQNPRVVLFA